MAKPSIRCGLTADGNIEAAIDISKRLVIDPQSGNVIQSTVREGTDAFRYLVTEARKWRVQ